MEIIQALNKTGIRWITSHAESMQVVIIPSKYLKTPAMVCAAELYVQERFLQKTNHARTKEGEFAIALAGMQNIQKAINYLAKELDGKTAVALRALKIPNDCKVIKIPKKATKKEFQKLEELAIMNL